MNARTTILTASALLALAGPGANPAGAMVPRDEGVAQSVQRSAQSGTGPVVDRTRVTHATASRTAIHTGAFAPWAYVQGGRSAAVGTAITAAGKKLARQPKVRVVTKIKKVRVPVYIDVAAPAAQTATAPQSATDDAYLCELLGIDCVPFQLARDAAGSDTASTDAAATDSASGSN